MEIVLRLLCFLLLSVCVYCAIKINIETKDGTKIPPVDDAACMARFIVHNSSTSEVNFNDLLPA